MKRQKIRLNNIATYDNSATRKKVTERKDENDGTKSVKQIGRIIATKQEVRKRGSMETTDQKKKCNSATRKK